VGGPRLFSYQVNGSATNWLPVGRVPIFLPRMACQRAAYCQYRSADFQSCNYFKLRLLTGWMPTPEGVLVEPLPQLYRFSNLCYTDIGPLFREERRS